MNPEVKTLWTTALRSGDYGQGRHALRSSQDKYCCLGVLCELAVKAEVIAPAIQHVAGFSDYRYDSTDGIPSTSVVKWAGITNGSMESLINMNDNDGDSFNYIADWIDRNL